MKNDACTRLLQWCLPRLGMRWAGFRKVRRQVCKRIARRMAALGLADADAYRRRLEADPAEWRVLDGLCRVTISRFFRDRGVFARLGDAVLPEIAARVAARGADTVRAWCAGCASGEEAYSLNVLWRLGAAGRTAPGLSLAIVATDADGRLLERARAGTYAAGSLRDLPADWRSAAFERIEDRYRLRPAFRAGVTFRREDIRRRAPRGPFDIILCRNMAFTYLNHEWQRRILRRLVTRLAPGGALVIGGHETLPETAGLEPDPVAPGLFRRPAAAAQRE